MIDLGGNWRLDGDSDARWVLLDESGRPVASVTSREELYYHVRRCVGARLTDEARERLAALPEHHPKYERLGPAQGQPR